MSEQETLPRRGGALARSCDHGQLPFLTGNTEGPVSLCFLKTLQSNKFNLQTNGIYTKGFANTTCLLFVSHLTYFLNKQHINLGVTYLTAMISIVTPYLFHEKSFVEMPEGLSIFLWLPYSITMLLRIWHTARHLDAQYVYDGEWWHQGRSYTHMSGGGIREKVGED